MFAVKSAAFFWLIFVVHYGEGYEKILLRQVEALTLRDGYMTTGRREAPVPQLMYRGSSYAKSYAPSVVQCRNKGHDGYDVQWECYADLANEVRFRNIDVMCEGFDYPEDPYVLKGSCGLEYTLELTGDQSNSRHYSPPSLSSTIMVIIAEAVLIFLVDYLSGKIQDQKDNEPINLRALGSGSAASQGWFSSTPTTRKATGFGGTIRR